MLAPPEEHDDGLAGDRHLEGVPDQGDGVARHAHVHPGELLEDPSGLAVRPDQPRLDLRDPALRVREVLDVEDIEVRVLTEQAERTTLRETAPDREDNIPRLERKDRVPRAALVDRDLARLGVHEALGAGGPLRAALRPPRGAEEAPEPVQGDPRVEHLTPP